MNAQEIIQAHAKANNGWNVRAAINAANEMIEQGVRVLPNGKPVTGANVYQMGNNI